MSSHPIPCQSTPALEPQSLTSPAEDARPRVLYVDTISEPHARCNISGAMKAFARVAELKVFDYRWAAAKYGVEKMNTILVQMALEFRPDLIHLGKCETVAGAAVGVIKNRLDTCVIHFYGDFRWNPQPWVVDIGRYADFTLFNYTDERIMAAYRKAGVRRIAGFWDSGADPEVFYPRDVPKTMDVVFMGSNLDLPHDGYPKRRQLVEAIAARGHDLHLFGRNWEYLDALGAPNVHRHPFVTEDAFAEMCSRAKVTIGINGVNDIRLYASWRRAVNTMASGAFHLTHHVPGMETLFENRRHLVWFSSVPEALELIDHYLAHDDERERIARSGRQEVLARHTWDARIADNMRLWRRHRREEGERRAAAYRDLREFTGLTDAQIEYRARTEVFDAEWERVWASRPRETAAQIRSAYNETDCYLMRNVVHNCLTQQARFAFTVEAIRTYCRQRPGQRVRLLNYGCGSGCLETRLLDIANLHIDLADIPSRTFDFVRWRFRDAPAVTCITIDAQCCLTRDYDIVICYDVLEHIPEPLPVLRHLAEHLVGGGLFFYYFCTALPAGAAVGPSGHLKQAIAQAPLAAGFVGKHFSSLGNHLYLKTGALRQVEQPTAFEFRTICEVHREIADKVHELIPGESKEGLLDLVAEAFDMAKRMNRKLRQYKHNYDEGMWEPNDNFEADIEKRLVRLQKRPKAA